jgi:hypothetical protein
MTMLRIERAQLPIVASALALCGVAGAIAAVRAPAAPLVAVAIALVFVSLANWRNGVTALLVVLPFSGVPVFMAGPAGLGVRDMAIVLPLYAAFALAMTRQRGALLSPLGIATPALAVFVLVVLGNVAFAPSLVVGVIGTKVWLAYIPMIAIGYHYVSSEADFDRAMRLTALLGLIPAAIALAEWFTAARYPQDGVWANNFGPARHLYGAWYAEVRTSSLSLPIGGHTFVVPRVPSTFTSSTQFYLFAMVAYAAGLSQALRSARPRWIGYALFLALGVIASGQRQAYVAMPLMTVLSVILAGPTRTQLAATAVAGCGFVLALFALGTAPLVVLSAMPDHARVELTHAWRELQSGVSVGLAGHGTGWDTQAALRYGGSASKRYVENWYAKAALELGIAGLAAIVTVLASLQWRLIARLRLIEPSARRGAAPMCALLLIMTATLFKGPVLDLDPLNVYFWLILGMLLSSMRLGRGDDDTPGEQALVRAEMPA